MAAKKKLKEMVKKYPMARYDEVDKLIAHSVKRHKSEMRSAKTEQDRSYLADSHMKHVNRLNRSKVTGKY